jgi:hypothetical protein
MIDCTAGIDEDLMPEEQQIRSCADIDEDTLEFHAMSKLSDGPDLQHIASCETCQSLVHEHRIYIDAVRRGLRYTNKTPSLRAIT